MIKKTISYYTDKKDDSVYLTSAIKTNNLYAPILFCICGNQSRERYLIPEDCKDEIISIGEYNPEKDQLRLMIVVSDKNKPFTPINEHPSNDICLEFENFSITVLWSYLNMPSHEHAINIYSTTTKETGPAIGLDYWEIYNLYTDINMNYANVYFKELESK